jgi:hypothetical protein
VQSLTPFGIPEVIPDGPVSRLVVFEIR